MATWEITDEMRGKKQKNKKKEKKENGEGGGAGSLERRGILI